MNVLLMIVLIVIEPKNSIALSIAYGIVNFLLFLYELAKAYSIGISNYLSYWNLMDAVRAGICYIWLIMDIFYND